eukprot:6392817-Pyramimonas_sp.AAC.2
MGDRLGRCGLFVVPEEAGDSGNDDVLFGAGQCSTPGKRAPEDEELLDEGSGGGTAALGEQTPAAKRSQPKGTGVDDIARWSAQKTPCRNTGVKSQKAEEKAADGEATLDRRAVKLLEERFRDFGKVDEIKTLSDVDGVLLWDALRSVRGAAARVHDHQVRDLRKRFAPPGTAEHDLRIRFPEDAWGRGPGALGPSRASVGSGAPLLLDVVTGVFSRCPARGRSRVGPRFEGVSARARERCPAARTRCPRICSPPSACRRTRPWTNAATGISWRTCPSARA